MKILFLALFLISIRVHGQTFFKPVPKVLEFRSAPRNPFVRTVASPVDSSLKVFRPITNIAAYGEPGHILMAGAGVSYQHLHWDIASAKWHCQWSVSGMMWAGGSVAPKTPADAISYGVMLGLLNNLIMVGPALNGNKIQAVVGLGINLNN